MKSKDLADHWLAGMLIPNIKDYPREVYIFVCILKKILRQENNFLKSFFFSFFLWLHLWYMEIPRPRTESEPQQKPEL